MKKIAFITLVLTVTLTLLLSGCVFGKLKSEGIKTSDGEIIVGEQVKWPDANMGGLSKPNANIVTVIKDNISGGCIVAFSEMAGDTATQYIANLKQQGYQPIFETSGTDGYLFSGSKSDGNSVTFTYTSSSKEGTITYTPAQGIVSGVTGVSEQTSVPGLTGVSGLNGNSSEAQAPVDMTDVSPWPNGFLPGVPELKGKIINVSNQNNQNVTVDLSYVEKSDFEAYVSTLKQNGYTVDTDEGKDSYTYDFRANNENGDYVNAYMYYESKMATVYLEKSIKE